METIVLNKIPFTISIEDIIKRFNIEDDEDKARIQSLSDEALKIGSPKGMYAEAFIEHRDEKSITTGPVTFISRVMCINLSEVYRIYPYVVTCGTELEEWSDSLGDPLENFWADTIKQATLTQAVKYLNEHVKSKFYLGKISSMNPGSLEDWPLSEQKKLFSLLGNTQEKIGVQLTDSFLMLPVKSVSGILFPAETGFENCQLCKREKCPGRRAPFDPVLFKEKYGLTT